VSENDSSKPTRRDADTVMAIGVFLVFFATATLIGSFWPMNYRARIVNTIGGLVLLGLGIGALWWSASLKRRAT
jgi:hypothetical protein